MMSPGWAQLHRDLRLEMGLDGLIVDLRFNAGGHVSQLVVEKLPGESSVGIAHAATNPSRTRSTRRQGPVVTVIDEQAGSDGDIAAAAIKILGLGPVVGTRTWGGVVGIDGRYQLVDGTSVTQTAPRLLAGGLRVGCREPRCRPRRRGATDAGRHRRRTHAQPEPGDHRLEGPPFFAEDSP